MTSSSAVPQYRANMSLMCGLIGGKKDTGMWLRGEMNRLVDPMLESLFLRLIISSSKSSAVPNCHLTVSELYQMVDEEKDETNRLLRCEMNRVVNSLFEKLTSKLLVNMDLGGSGDVGYNSQMVNPSDQVNSLNLQSHQPASHIAQTSTFNLHSQQPRSIGHKAQNNPEILTEVKRELEEGNEMVLMDDATQMNQFGTSVDNHHFLHEIDSNLEDGQFENRTIFNDNNQQPTEQVSNATKNETQQDCYQTEIKEEGDNEQMMLIEEEEEEMEDGECQFVQNASTETHHLVDIFESDIRDEFDDETNNGQIEDEDDNEEGGDDETEIDSDNDDWIEDSQEEESSRSVEYVQMETTPTHSIRQSQMILRQSVRLVKQTLSEKVNKRDNPESTEIEEPEDVEEVTSLKRPRPSRSTTLKKTKPMQVITLTLQCPQNSCNKMIHKDKFTKHMEEEHLIGAFRCIVKDCSHSFENSLILGQHIVQSHQSTNQWHCAKCDHHFTSYLQLSNHYHRYHKLGHFQCAFPECPFTGNNKVKVYFHYSKQHKQTVLKYCPHPGCKFETSRSNDLKLHQRVHLDIKPFECKWSQCDFAAKMKKDTIVHIRRMHFKGKPSSSVRLDDYLEVNLMKIDEVKMRLNNPDGHDASGDAIVIKKNTQVITLTLQCLQCGLMFAKDDLSKHLKEKHSIRPVSCLVKDCGQSFEKTRLLIQHLAQSHQSTTQWHCYMCDHHYPSYIRLSQHNTKLHQLGQFQCSYPSCTFTEKCRSKVLNHYTAQHRSKTLRKCQHSGCQYETQNGFEFNRHQRIHLGAKPFKCKWCQCDFAARKKSDTIRHIRLKHLARNPSSVPNRDPSYFVEVLPEKL